MLRTNLATDQWRQGVNQINRMGTVEERYPGRRDGLRKYKEEPIPELEDDDDVAG